MSRYRRRLMMASQEKEEYIVFADPVVEQICATNWGDGVGITPSQAARVTSQQFGQTFRGNISITSFDELEYFTGLTTIPEHAFRGCTGLTTMKLPATTLVIGAYAFSECTNLTGELILPDRLTTIHSQAFTRTNFNVGTVYIPSTINTITRGSISDLHTNLTFPSTVQDVPVSWLYVSNGGNLVYVPNNVVVSGNETIGFDSIHIGGDIVFSVSSDNYFGSARTRWKELIVDGNIDFGSYTNSLDHKTNSTVLSFIEIGGQVTGANSTLLGNDLDASSGCVIHFKYNGVATTPSIACASYKRVGRIYVGTGVSQAADEAILALYLADPAWAAYADKLDTWYNAEQYITFADSAVEAICMANWSNDGIGFKRKDAAVVRDISAKFFNNTTITSFNEFKYFYGVGGLRYDTFGGCSSLTEITLPDSRNLFIRERRSLGNIGREIIINLPRIDFWYEMISRSTHCPSGGTGTAFDIKVNGTRIESVSPPLGFVALGDGYGGPFTCWKYLKNVTVPSGETTIGMSCFRKCESLQSVTLPQTITTIKEKAFSSAAYLNSGLQNTLSLPNLTSIETYAFEACRLYSEYSDLGVITDIPSLAFYGAKASRVNIPATVTTVGNDRPFGSSTQVTTVYMYPTTPPQCSSTSAIFNNSTTNVYVPAASVNDYQTTSPWSLNANKISAIPT